MSAANPIATLQRQRVPFLPLLVLAICGIFLAEHMSVPSTFWLIGTLAAAAVFFAGHRRMAFGAFALCAFATLHLWRSDESQAALFADWLGFGSVAAEVRGTVVSEPRVLSPEYSSVEVRVSQLQLQGYGLAPSFVTRVDWPGTPPSYGDEVLLRGALSRIEPPRNPGQFNFAAWSARQRIFTRLQVTHRNDAEILRPNQGNPLVSLALRTRAWLRQTLTAGVNDPAVSDLLVAMVLGDVSSLPQSVQEEFRGTGTFHLFSVSGLHVGMIAVLLWYLLKAFRVPRRHAAGWIIPMLFFYVLMTGLKAPSVRSALMAAIVLAGLMANRKPVLFNNLCAAGFLILLADSNELFNPGFQLSFCVVAAIMLFAGPLSSSLAAPFRPDPFVPERLLSAPRRFFARETQRLCSLVAVSTAAWLGSLPLTIGYFHLVSITALPANTLAVPLSFAIMAVSMLSLGSGLFSAWLASIYNQTNWLLAKALFVTVHAFASLPGSFFYVRLPDPPSPLVEVVVFDFGAGGAAWIGAQGRDWLIDSGPADSHDSVLLPFLRSRGLRTLDGFLLTHGDAGHIGSATELLRACPPRHVVDSTFNDRSTNRSRFHGQLVGLGVPKSPHRAGDRITLGPETRLHVLYPPGDVQRGVADDKGLVVQLRAGSTRILFMSDAGLYTEAWLVKNVPHELRSDILIKGSPRQGPSGDNDFLDAVKPRAVIATATAFPDNERITAYFSQALRIREIPLFAQDQCGAVIVRIFADYWEVSAFLNGHEYSRVR
ncbi:MAG TPA: ComEC/Rec2 family competence protein [Terrimicrobiaceae bacterium]|nr:ComEC/Rec2 family competence protein [Terrimicrobiaceae bacterium]